MINKYQNYIVATILLVMFVVSLAVSREDAAIMDEVAHIPAGYSYVRYQDFRLNPEHPPLLKDLAGIPLQFMDVTFPTSEKFWTTDANGQWDAGWKFIYFPGNDTEGILFWSRLPIILIWLLLGWLVFYWTRDLFGVKAGLLAVSLFALDPNILGHNHYVTTDLGIAAFLFFAFYFFYKYLKNPGWKSIVFAGIFMALAQLAKFSAVLMFPVMGVTLILYAIFRNNDLKFSFLWSGKIKKFWARKLYFYLATFTVIFLIHIILIGLVYELNTFRMPPEKIHQLVDTQLYGGSKTIMADVLHKMADNSVFRPYSQYLTGLLMVFGRVAGGNTTYFFGRVTNQSFREYFPLVFLIKEPLPILILILSAISIGAYFLIRNNLEDFPKHVRKNFNKYFDEHIAEVMMMLFIALYAYVSITGNLNIGFRHLFPILPFIYILVAKEIGYLANHLRASWRKYVWGFALLLIVWLGAGTALAYPYYMAYFNETIGGSKNGYKYVTDSNVDWGQELKHLSEWVDQNNVKKIRVDYFGGGDVMHYLGDKAIIWHADMGQEPGWYAISATFLQNSLYYKIMHGEPDYQWLREREPYTSIGHSILIYKID